MYNRSDNQEDGTDDVPSQVEENKWQEGSAILSQTESQEFAVSPGVYSVRRGSRIPRRPLSSPHSSHVYHADKMHCSAQQRATGRRVLKDILQLYLDEISSTPLLTREQEVEIGAKAYAGDPKAKEQMIKANLRLVVTVAKNYIDKGLPFLDLIAEGNIGLMVAVDKFNPEKFNNKFCTYAAWWIKNHIRRALLDKSRIVRLPAHIGSKMSKILKAQSDLEESLGRAPLPEEIAEKVGKSEECIRSWMNFNTSPSLDAMSENGYDVPLNSDIDGSGDVERSDLIERMFEKLVEFPEKEQALIVWRFGLNGEDALTLSQIGEKVGMTGERVRQMLEVIIKKMERLLKK